MLNGREGEGGGRGREEEGGRGGGGGRVREKERRVGGGLKRYERFWFKFCYNMIKREIESNI